MAIRYTFVKKFLFSEKLAQEESFIPLQIIFFIAFYIPFEDLVSSWLPLPDVGVGITRLIPDLIIYFILFRIIFIRKVHNLGFNKTFIDPLLIAFLLCFGLSVTLNQSDILSSLDHLRTSWRYVAIYYILININCSLYQTGHFLKILKRIGILQGVLASFQFFLPSSVKIALANGGCDKAVLKGASCGSFVDSALLSCFLLIVISLVLTELFWKYSLEKKITMKNLFPIVILYFGLFASKKRAALFFAAFIPIFTLLLFNRKKLLGVYLWFIVSLITVAIFILPFLVAEFNLVTQESAEVQVDVSSYFLRILSGDYWNEFFLNARGWFIVIIGQTLSKSGSWFGFGPDLSTTVEKMSYVMFRAIDIAKLERDQDVFYDAYWFAQLAFYGITGISIYWSILYLLYKESWEVLKNSLASIDRYLAIVFCTLVIIGFIYSFVERLFMLRVFSFYFWLFAGLVTNARLNRSKML
jgi:hypothetical protein